MPTKLRGNTNNKLQDYKNSELSKTQEHILKHVHAFDLDNEHTNLTKTELADLAKEKGRNKIMSATNQLIHKELVEQAEDNKLSLSEKGRKQL